VTITCDRTAHLSVVPAHDLMPHQLILISHSLKYMRYYYKCIINVLRSIVFLTLGVSAKSLKNLPSKCLASELLNVGSLSKYFSENVLLRLSVVSNRNIAAPATKDV
jgi:hypothetical protein